MSRWVWPGLMGAAYLAALAIMNPLREFAFSDDWAYALTVRRLLETGIYTPHDFVASNFPFQAYWGALFASLSGYSLTSLHLSTLALTLIGLGGFFMLAREHGIGIPVALLLTFVLAASPLVLEFGVTFMTDVPFLAMIILALAFTTRGLRLGSAGWMLAGSIPAACAILIRQFGAALVPGLALVWVFSRDRKTLSLVAAGSLLPLAALAHQLVAGASHPNWATRSFSLLQAVYLSDVGTVAAEGVWRIGVTLQYMALFCLPLVIPAGWDFVKRLRHLEGIGSRSAAYRLNLWLLGLLPLILAISAAGTFGMGKPGLLPLVSWNFDVFTHWPRPASALLTLVTLLGAFLLARLIALRTGADPARPLASYQTAIDWITLCLFVPQLILFQFGDEYLLPLILPYILIAAGTALGDLLNRWRAPLTALTAALLLISSLWAQGNFNGVAAQWQAARRLLDAGVDPNSIYTSAWEWNSYYGAFDAYLASTGYNLSERYGPYFDEWLPQRLHYARYVIFPAEDQPLPVGVRVIDRVPYQQLLAGPKEIIVVDREP